MSPELDAAFANARRQVERAIAEELRARDGEPAHDRLVALRDAIDREHAEAATHGTVNPDWIARTVRDVAAWTPDTELALLAALGGIHRAARSSGQ